MSSVSLPPALSAPEPPFIVRVLRFHFVAQDLLYFPAYKSGNILRGAFGMLLRAVAPEADYLRLFEPKPLEKGPSGLADLPRPFVFRASHLDGVRVAAGEAFQFNVNLFTPDAWPVPYFEAAFRALATQGLGPGRGKASLASLETSLLQFDFAPQPAGSVTLNFVTPTELKGGTGAEFPVLLARLRDRISNLQGVMRTDYRDLVDEASAVTVTESALTRVNAERTSSRTGQTHPLSGFVGQVTYAGVLDRFIPYLRCGQYTGVGRQTVWGKGEFRVLGERDLLANAIEHHRDAKPL